MAGRGRIRWLDSQVERLRSAVARYNSTVKAWGASGAYDIVPKLVDFNDEQQRITTRDELYRRVNQLNRANEIKLGHAPNETKTVNGTAMPYYLWREVKMGTDAANRNRRKVRDRLYPNWDEMSSEEQASKIANRNLTPLEYDFSAQGYEDLRREREFVDEQYANNYLQVWEQYSRNHPDYILVRDIINDFMERKPGVLQQIFEGNDDEKEIYFIYTNSPDKTPFEIRQSRAARFWASKADEYNLYMEDVVDSVKSSEWNEVIF